MQIRILVGIALILAAPVYGGEPKQPNEEISFENVTALLQANPQVDSVEGFLPLLPAGLRNNFVLMHTSESLHRACVTPDHPRVIFYSESAQLIIAAAAAAASPNPGAAACNAQTLELIQFRPEQNAFEFHSIEFAANQRPKVSAANPPRCLTCHSQDPHPIWGSYFVWPGTYGTMDDTILESRYIAPEDRQAGIPLETSGYETFMAKNRYTGIYRALNWKNGRDQINLGRPSSHTPKPPGWTPYSTAYRPNLILQQKIKGLNHRRVKRLLETSSDEASFRDAITYVRDCAKSVDGLEPLLRDLPEGPRKFFMSKPIPRTIPADAIDDYSYEAENGNWGHWQDLVAYDPFAADQAAAYEEAFGKVEQTLPRRWWGYLQVGQPGNPSNTELPRRPQGDFRMILSAAKNVSVFEFFMNARGLSTQNWPTSREGYWGVSNEIFSFGMYAGFTQNCSQTRERAIQMLTDWWKRNATAL